MWAAILDSFKGLFSSKGAMEIVKDNTAVTAGDGATVYTAGRDVIVHSDGASEPKSEKEELIEWLRNNGFKEPVSHILPQLIRLAQRVGNKEIEHWAQMELFGYNRDGGMTESDVVPEYRAVVGQYYDAYGRALQLPPRWHFLNSNLFRYGVAMLEEWSKKTEMGNIHDPDFIEILEKDLNVKVVRYCFSPLGLVEIVNLIRNHALKKFGELEKA
jgi:hypothetical protein